MAENSFIVELIARLNKSKSQKQIKSDIKEIEGIKIPLIGTLSKPKTRKQIKEDAKNLGDINTSLIGKLNKSKTKAQIEKDLETTNSTVNLTGKVDSKGVAKSVQQTTSQAQKEVDSKPLEMSFTVKKEKLINDIKLLAQQNTKLFKNNDMAVKYNTLLDSAEMAKNTVELSTLRTQLGSLRSELKVTGNAGLTMTDALKNGLSKVLQLFGGHGIVMQFTAQLRNAWKEAKELDSAMTNLSRVNSGITRSGFPDYLDKVISKTKELSVATKDYIDAVTTFSRAGYNLADSEILASMAVQLEKVGDMSSEDASKSLLSGLQAYAEIDGYGMDQLAEKAQALNDKIDLIGNTASISQKEVAEGIQAVGSVMSDANTSVDEFLSLLAAGNRSVQDSNKVALAIRTSALRIRGCTSELEEYGESVDDVIESTSTLAAKIKALTNIDGNGGVNILEADEKTFRSIYDIYNDIAKVYDKMSDVDASALLDLIAGKNRSNQVSAILQNMSEANELLEKSLSATGTASAEYEIYLNSVEAATERFAVAMTETYSNIIGGETVKGLTNAATAVLDFANKWGLVETSLKGFMTLGILKGITTLSVAFKNSAVQVSNYGMALDSVKIMSKFASDTEKYANAMNTLKASCTNLTDAQLKQVLANKNLSESQLIEILQLDSLEAEQRKARLSQLGLTQATEAQTTANSMASASTFSFSSAVKGLGANLKNAIMSNRITLAIMAISAIIGVVTSQISKHNQKLEENRQKAKELTDTYKQQQSSLESQTKKYKELKESLDSGNLSTDEARSVKEQLLEIQNSLIDSYGNEASNLDLVNGKYKEQLGLLDELSKEKAADFIIENRDVYNDAKNQLEKERTYDLGTVTSWSEYSPKTEDQQALLDYIEAYSDFLELTYKGGADTFAVSVSVKADVQNADEVMRKFAKDLEEYANANGFDVSNILDQIPEQLRNTWTDDLKEYKQIYDEFIQAEVIRNDTLRPLYQQSIQAVEDYNNALSAGEGIAEAKAHLDSLQQSVQNAADEIEGSQDIFDDIYEGINKNAEAAYQLSQAFEDGSTVQEFAEQLRGLSDIDVKAISLDNENIERGEEAFRGLLDTLGYTEPTEEQIQSLTDKLVELGYVIGETETVLDMAPVFDLTAHKDSIDDTQSAIEKLAGSLAKLESGDLSSSELLDLIQEFPILADETGNLSDAIEGLVDDRLESLISSLEEAGASDGLISLIRNVAAEAMQSESDIDSLSSSIGSLQSAYGTLSDAVEEYNSTGALSLDMLQALLSLEPQYLNCLITENGQLALNTEALAMLTNKRLDDAEAQAVQNTIEQLNTLTEQANAAAKEQNAISADSARIKTEGYTAALSDMATKAVVAAGAVSELNSALDGAVTAGVAQKDIDAVMGTLDAQVKAIESTRKKLGSGSIGSVLGKSGSASKASSSSSTDSYKEAFEKELKELQYLRDKDVISETEYYQQLKALNEEYFAGKKQYLDEYRQYELEVYKYEKELNNKIMSELQSSTDGLQAALKALRDAQSEIVDHGTISLDTLQSLLSMEPRYLALLADENGQIQINEEAFRRLAAVKVEEMQITYARQCIDLVNTLTSEAAAAEWLAGANRELTGTTISLTEALLQQAVAAAHLRGELQGQAADTILQAYNNAKQLIGQTDFSSIESLSGETRKTAEEMSSDISEDFEDSTKEMEDTFEEMVDFFERRVDVLEDALSLLKANMENVSGSLARNSLLDAQLGITEEKINNYTDALDMYTQKANEALSKLPADIAAQVRDGAVAITDFIGSGNEDIVDAIDEYGKWADKIADCKQELAELQSEIRQLELDKFNNVMEDFNNQYNLRSDSKDLISKQIDLLKEAGQMIGESFFEKQIEQSQKQLELLEAEKIQLVNQMGSAISSGRVQKGTDEWLEMVNALTSVEGNILDCKKSIEEFDNELLNLHTEVFNRIQNRFSDLGSELSNIIDLFDDMEVSDDKGVWSKEGLAQLGLLTQQYELAKHQVQQYSDEIDELNAQYLAGRYSATEYADRLADLSSAQWDAVGSAESAKDAIMDLNETRVNKAVDGIEKEVDAYKKLIDAQLESLGREKELHDYKQSIADKNKAVADIERQIAALQYDTSASGVARRKKLEEQLVEAKKTLAEAEYEHSIQVQEDALNKQYENYKKERDDEIAKLKESLNDRDAILAESFETVKENAATIGQEIANIAIEHGVTVSDALISSWRSGEDAIASYGEALSQNTSAFIGNIMGVENEIWNLQAQADSTADSLAWMFSTRADRLVNELTQSYHAEENLSNMTNILQQSLVNTLERGYNVSSIVNSLNSIKDAANEAANAVSKVGNSAAATTATTAAPKTSAPTASTTTNNASTSRPKTNSTTTTASKNDDDEKKKKYIGGGASTPKHFAQMPLMPVYASGTRDAEDGLRVINEEGRELTLPKLKSGNYAIGNAGDQILTKKQTDNIFEWSKMNPAEMHPLDMVDALWGKVRMPEPVIDRKMSAPVNNYYESMFAFNGDVIDADRAIKQMEKVALKITDQRIDKSWREFSDKLRYG